MRPPYARRRKSGSNADATSAKRAAIDRWLPRLNHFSQIGLLLLATFGYFYTVVPLYQKAVLEEDIAKKQIELKAAQTQLEQKERELAQTRKDLEASYATVRRFEVHPFVFKAGFTCSALGLPTPDVSASNRRHRPRIEELLELPVADCLRNELAQADKRKRLRSEDSDKLREETEKAIAMILAKREEIVRAYDALRPVLKAESEAYLIERSKIRDIKEMLNVQSIVEGWRKLDAKPLELYKQYDSYIRSQLISVENAVSPVADPVAPERR